MAGALEDQLILDFLLGKVSNTDGLEVGCESALVFTLLVIGVTNLNIALKPRILELKHLLKRGNGRLDVAHLYADLRNTSQVVEVLFVLHSRDATLRKLRHILAQQVLCQIDQNLILFNIGQSDVLVSVR